MRNRANSDMLLKLRIYGMTYFDEDKPYWGNITRPIIGAGDGRLTARSVKIFADGKSSHLLFHRFLSHEEICRGLENRRICGETTFDQ
jgi:hypothetical protein